MAENENTQTDSTLLDLRDTASAVAAQLRVLSNLDFRNMGEGDTSFGMSTLLSTLAGQLDGATAT
jgi:hypothetical protein